MEQVKFRLKDMAVRSAFRLDGMGAEGGFDLSHDQVKLIRNYSATDYNKLMNKPKIEDVELTGNKDLEEFGMTRAQNTDILSLFR